MNCTCACIRFRPLCAGGAIAAQWPYRAGSSANHSVRTVKRPEGRAPVAALEVPELDGCIAEQSVWGRAMAIDNVSTISNKAAEKPRYGLTEFGAVWWGGWLRLCSRLWMIIAACVAGIMLVLIAGPTDVSLQQEWSVENHPNIQAFAKVASKHSDLNFAIPFGILIWGAGIVLGRVRLRKLGMACLMGTLMAGLVVMFFRFGMGRPRPDAAVKYKLADGFYGPHLENDFRSFPSGHATTSSATAACVGGAMPVLALPGLLYTFTVSWSRIQLDKHHPIDVTIGTICGTICGLCFASTVPGSPVRLRRKRKRKLR
jgi:membrane-associated phospholipid phosphatase